MQNQQTEFANDNLDRISEATNLKLCVSIEEASKILGIGITKFYEELNANRIKAKRFGRRTLVSYESLKEWFNELPDF